MQVLGLLQNAWAKDTKRVEEVMMRFGRRATVTRLLMRSKSGQVLRKRLPDWYNRIEYENSSPRVLSRADAYGTVDLAHVRNVIANIKPAVIIAFGNVAKSAMTRLGWNDGVVIITQHPRTGLLYTINGLLNDLEQRWQEKP